MARKKIVFVLVEGQSDTVALEVYFERHFPSDNGYVVLFDSLPGVFTSERGVNASNILGAIGKFIKGRFKTRHPSLKIKDVDRIVQVVDTDGTFVSDDAIVRREGVTIPLYTPEAILVDNPDGIRFRNKCKRENMNRLVQARDLLGVPYRLYYMSCNLDHVLYDEMNAEPHRKVRKAEDFAIRHGLDDFYQHLKSF